jgi:glycosyltransferase involved in cell wall biosynthesis
MKKILVLTSTFGLGGADKQILKMALALHNKEFCFKIISFTPLGSMAAEGLSKGLDIETMNMPRGKSNPFRVFSLITKTISFKPDLVVSFMYHAILVGRLVALMSGRVPHIGSIRSMGVGSGKREFFIKLGHFLDTRIVPNSEYTRNMLVERGIIKSAKSDVVPNGIDLPIEVISLEQRLKLRKELNVPEHGFFWLIVARMTVEKDIPLLLSAIKLLKQDGLDPYLRIIGKGILMPRVEEIIRENELERSIFCVGTRSDVMDLYQAADASVLSSRSEGLPNVLIESLATGTPAVATNVGGIPEIIQDGVSGYLVPPENSTELYRWMKKMMILTNTEREKMGSRGADFISSGFESGKVIDKWQDLFNEVIS